MHLDARSRFPCIILCFPHYLCLCDFSCTSPSFALCVSSSLELEKTLGVGQYKTRAFLGKLSDASSLPGVRVQVLLNICIFTTMWIQRFKQHTTSCDFWLYSINTVIKIKKCTMRIAISLSQSLAQFTLACFFAYLDAICASGESQIFTVSIDKTCNHLSN